MTVVRDRVTAIQKALDKSEAACRTGYERVFTDRDDPQWMPYEDVFASQLREIADSRWLARTLLEALDTIDRLKGEVKRVPELEAYCDRLLLRLNGGNESGNDR